MAKDVHEEVRRLSQELSADPRFELRTGKFGPYFHDNKRGGDKGYDMPLATVLDKLNRLEEYTQRLGRINKKRFRG